MATFTSIACTKPKDKLRVYSQYVKNHRTLKSKWYDDLLNYVDYQPSEELVPGHSELGIPVLTHPRSIDWNHPTERMLIPMYWTFIPAWSDIGIWKEKNTHVANVNEVCCNTGYSSALENLRRCAILMDGYYLKKEKEGGKTQYYYVESDPAGQLLYAAGLYDVSHYKIGNDPVRKHVFGCCILTTAAKGNVPKVANEVPLLLNRGSDLESWVNSLSYPAKKTFSYIRQQTPPSLRFTEIDKPGTRTAAK